MAEGESGEKTEAPTPRRLQEAREAGQVARSQDMTAAAMLRVTAVSVMPFQTADFSIRS